MDMKHMIKDYTDWLYSEFSAVQVGEYFELTTPYLDRYNDHMQIYVKQEANGSFFLTDDGYILDNLNSSGISISRSQKRKDMLTRIIRNYGIDLHENSLVIRSSKNDYPQKKHMLIQAMLTIDDMFIAEPNTVKSFFTEDVGAYLDENQIYYSRDFSLVGRTGSLYVYDYHLQRTPQRPERFCKAINHLNESSRNLTLFNWVDTREKRSDRGELIVFLNDEKNIDAADMDAFRAYDTNCILWSQRHDPENLALLA